jgi:predicted dehydrogenase
MKKQPIYNVGVVGAAARGAYFTKLLARTGYFHCQAVCDTNEEGLLKIQKDSGAPEAFLNYEDMLDRADIQAVFIGTPMQHHAGMAIAALDRGIHVLCEVTAAISVDECRQLVQAAARSSATYMLAENYTFTRPNQIIKKLVAAGLFGVPYYAEGEYIHELKERMERTPWRRRWASGINGITYGTHSLGPILQWMPGDRVVSVSCVGSGHHWIDPRGDHYENEATCVMLAKTARGALIKIRVDVLSDRPHAMTNYSLQGTDAAYESARAEGEPDRIWVRSRNPVPDKWENLSALEPQHTPEMWRDPASLEGIGHGGGDLLELFYWRDVLLGRKENELGIHQAMDFTLPGLISQESIKTCGAWLPVPDSRDWLPSESPAKG